ncbi:MAG: HEAT repeat domain-containing protein [Vampirovibrionales bacterium]
MSTALSSLLSPAYTPDPLAQEAFALTKAEGFALVKSFIQHTAMPQQTSSRERLDALLASDYGLINKQHEWGILSKALYAGQSRTFLLLGDEGLGKTSFINAYFKSLAENRDPEGDYAPHQAIKIQLSHLPKPLWATWQLDAILQEALVSWVKDTLAAIQNNANQRLQEVGIRINDEQFKLMLTQFSKEPSRAARYDLWLNTLKHALSKKQNLIQKWTAPSQLVLEDVARILNNPWAVVAFQTSTSLADDPDADISQRLVEMAQGVKAHVSNVQSPASFSLLIDEWDVIRLQNASRRDANNQSLLRLVKAIQTQKQIPLCLTLTSRTNALSQHLGGSLYASLRDKLLLSSYGEEELQTLVKTCSLYHEKSAFSVPKEALPLLSTLSEGQGYKALAVYQAWVKKAEQLGEMQLSLESLNALAIEKADELEALLYARLQLDALSHGASFINALELVVAHLDHTPFTVEAFISERLKTASTDILASHLALALRKLYLYGIVQKLETPSASASPLYNVPSRHALESVYRFFVAKNVEALFQKTQGLLSPSHTLEKEAESNETDESEATLSRTAFLEQGEALVQILPKTFNEGELPLEKLQSVLSFLSGLPRENAQYLREKIARFLIQALEHPLEARRLEALLCLGYIPLLDALDALVDALNHPNSLVKQQALQSLRQWISTATEAKIPVQDKVLPVVEALLIQLNPREGFPRKDDALIQSLVFDALKQWHKGEARTVFKGVHAYVKEHLNNNDDSYLSVGFLDCLAVLLKPFDPTDIEHRMPWVFTLIEKSFCVPQLQASGFTLLRLLPAQMPQVQAILKQILQEQASPTLTFDAFVYTTELLALPDFQTVFPLWKESLQTYLERLYLPKASYTQAASFTPDDDRQQLIQATLHLLKVVKKWNAPEKSHLANVLEEGLTSPEWQGHLDLLWVLLRLQQQLAGETALKDSTARYLGQLKATPTSHLLKQLLTNV